MNGDFVTVARRTNPRRRLRCDKAAPLIDDLTNHLTVIGLCSARLGRGEGGNVERAREDNLQRIRRSIERASDLAEQLKTLCEDSAGAAVHAKAPGRSRKYGYLSLVLGRSKP